MRGYLLVAAVTAAAALTGLVPADGVRAGAAAPGTRAVPGTQLWVARFPAGGQELSSAMVVSPDGRRVFVTGVGWGGRVTGDDSETAAYSAATGRRLWFSRYRGPGRLAEEPSAVAVSPGGGTVFVTGDSHGPSGASDYATVAYSAATGRRLWVSRYKGPVNGPGGASAVAVSPGGGIVFVTGLSPGRGNGFVYDYATVAYSAAAGRQLWVRRYSGPVKGPDIATAVAVSPGGGTVFVTGGSPVRGNGTEDYATVAYDAATGRQLWVRRYSGPVKGPDAATAVAVSPGGAAVFVTGRSRGRGNGIEDYATVAYDAATGQAAVGQPLPERRGCLAGGEPGRGHGVRDRDRRGLRDGRLQRRHREAAVGPPLSRRVPGLLGGGEPGRGHGVRDRERRRQRLCDGRLQRRGRPAAVGPPLQRPRDEQRRLLRSREPRRDHGVRDRVDRDPDELRLRHHRLPRLRRRRSRGWRSA